MIASTHIIVPFSPDTDIHTHIRPKHKHKHEHYQATRACTTNPSRLTSHSATTPRHEPRRPTERRSSSTLVFHPNSRLPPLVRRYIATGIRDHFAHIYTTQWRLCMPPTLRIRHSDSRPVWPSRARGQHSINRRVTCTLPTCNRSNYPPRRRKNLS